MAPLGGSFLWKGEKIYDLHRLCTHQHEGNDESFVDSSTKYVHTGFTIYSVRYSYGRILVYAWLIMFITFLLAYVAVMVTIIFLIEWVRHLHDNEETEDSGINGES